MNYLRKPKVYFIYLLLFLPFSCKKDFLDAKPRADILSPSTIAEFQKLLDNTTLNIGIGLGILAADEYQYSSFTTWLAMNSLTARNSYIWAKDIYEVPNDENWVAPYYAVFYANNVLKGLEKIKRTQKNANEWDQTKGWAFFIRGFSFYDLVDNYAPIYDEATATIDLGIPLKLNPYIDEIIPRSSVRETFDQIFIDLTEANKLLPPELPAVRTRPSKVAVHALLSRIYLNMRNYNNAELHSDSCLRLYKKLIDYNSISKTSTTPFGYNHDEQIYAKIAVSNPAYASTGANTFIDMSPELIDLYEPNDLRLQIFFSKQKNGTYDVKRSYYGNLGAFIGLATDEVFLIKSECLARRGETKLSMDFLNQLRVKRFDASSVVPYENLIAINSNDALEKVLIERRRELVFRGTRWSDIKRLNKEGANIGLKRVLNSQEYDLPPNSLRYIFPIPNGEINFSGIQQNPR